MFDLSDKEELLTEQIKRPYYNGKPTKKYQKLLNLQQALASKMKSELQREYNKIDNEKL